MAQKKEKSPKLSIEQIQKQIEQIEVDRKKLEKALKERRTAELVEFAQTLREQIAERGYKADEVIALLTKRRRVTSRKEADSQYTRYVDPENPKHSYVRGPIPRWLKEKMAEAGYDPRNKNHREEFKSTRLNRAT